MKRYPMFDPPEYVDWKPAAGIIEEYQRTISRDPQRANVISQLTQKQLLDLYAGMLRFRLHDITLRRWVKQGILAKAWLGTGEEAVTIGSVHALDRSIDKVAPMIRNAGACHEMGMPLVDMLPGGGALPGRGGRRACLQATSRTSRGTDVDRRWRHEDDRIS